MVKIESVGGLLLHVCSEKIEANNHVFAYVASGGYYDNEVFVSCIIGYDQDKEFMGFIRYGDGEKILPLMSFGTEYRDKVFSPNLNTEEDWLRRGYKLLPGAIAEELYFTSGSKTKELYYGRQDVIETDLVSLSII